MAQYQLFGIDASGRTVHAEFLQGSQRSTLRTLARERLRDWHTVEIWEGPMCVVRLSRSQADEG